MKQVLIKMTSIQVAEDDKNETELTTEGSFERLGNTWKISYEDSSATGVEGSVTTIEVDGSKMVSIERTGTSASNLMIEKGKKHYCLYDTPYGDMTVGIFTHQIQNHLNDAGGTLHFKYTVDINSAFMSDNEIYLDVQDL